MPTCKMSCLRCACGAAGWPSRLLPQRHPHRVSAAAVPPSSEGGVEEGPWARAAAVPPPFSGAAGRT